MIAHVVSDTLQHTFLLEGDSYMSLVGSIFSIVFAGFFLKEWHAPPLSIGEAISGSFVIVDVESNNERNSCSDLGVLEPPKRSSNRLDSMLPFFKFFLFKTISGLLMTSCGNLFFIYPRRHDF